jgi:hypothetical protein
VQVSRRLLEDEDGPMLELPKGSTTFRCSCHRGSGTALTVNALRCGSRGFSNSPRNGRSGIYGAPNSETQIATLS